MEGSHQVLFVGCLLTNPTEYLLYTQHQALGLIQRS